MTDQPGVSSGLLNLADYVAGQTLAGQVIGDFGVQDHDGVAATQSGRRDAVGRLHPQVELTRHQHLASHRHRPVIVTSVVTRPGRREDSLDVATQPGTQGPAVGP